MELYSIIFRLAKPEWYSNYDPNSNRISDLSYPYLKDIDDHFGRYNDSKAVKMALEMSEKGFSAGYLFLLALYTDTGDKEILEEIVSNTDVSEEEVKEFIAAANEFSKETNFPEFYKNHTEFYNEIVERFVKDNQDAASVLPVAEAFFQIKLKEVTLLLAPSLANYYFSDSFGNSKNTSIYISIGIYYVRSGKPLFNTDRVWVNAPLAIVWLTSAPLFSDALKPYEANLSQYQALYDAVVEVMKMWDIDDVSEMVMATSDAAFTTYYLNFTYGSKTADDYMWIETTAGLYMLPEFMKVVSIYTSGDNMTLDDLVRRFVETTDEVYTKTNGGKDLSKVIATPTVLDFIRNAKKTGAKVFYTTAGMDEARRMAAIFDYNGVKNYTLQSALNLSSKDMKGNVVLILNSDDLLFQLLKDKVSVEFNGSTVYSKVTGKRYKGSVVFVEIIENPWDKNGLIYLEITQDWTLSTRFSVFYLTHYAIYQAGKLLETR